MDLGGMDVTTIGLGFLGLLIAFAFLVLLPMPHTNTCCRCLIKCAY